MRGCQHLRDAGSPRVGMVAISLVERAAAAGLMPSGSSIVGDHRFRDWRQMNLMCLGAPSADSVKLTSPPLNSAMRNM